MENNPLLAPAYELADGDKDFLRDILESMATNIPEDLMEIERALEHKQLDQACRSAHHMKSSIMYTGAEDLRQLLSEIEVKKDGETSLNEIKALFPKAKEMANNLVTALKAELAK